MSKPLKPITLTKRQIDDLLNALFSADTPVIPRMKMSAPVYDYAWTVWAKRRDIRALQGERAPSVEAQDGDQAMSLGNYDGWKLRTPEDDGADHSSENDPSFCYECQNHLDDCECDLDGPEADDDRDRGCVLGADCLHHDPFHTAAECFDVEMAEHFMGGGE